MGLPEDVRGLLVDWDLIFDSLQVILVGLSSVFGSQLGHAHRDCYLG